MNVTAMLIGSPAFIELDRTPWWTAVGD